MKNIKCILIDDDDDDHEFFKMAIGEINHSFDYTLTTNGTEILNSLKESTSTIPDYIFLDLNMPYLDGKKCLEQIKGIEHLNQCKVVIFSGSSSKKDIEELNSMGANHYLIKPSTIESLIKSLDSVFGEGQPPFLIEP